MGPVQPAHDDEPLLRMRSMSKSFPGVQALDGVDLELNEGECVAIIGENGAGKSTLIKLLAGIHAPDSGEILLKDMGRVQFASAHESLACGISVIHQELNLAVNLDVAANIFLGREPMRLRAIGLLNGAEMNRRTRELLDLVGLERAPDTPMTSLSLAESQLVEIAKALSMEARIVIMDEPTSALSPREAEILFGVIDDLKARGIGVLYITHRLGEIGRVADRVVALRDGRRVGELEREKATEEAMVRLMIGRDITEYFPKARARAERVVLEVKELRPPGAPHAISFRLHAGEILGFAGLVGAGRTEVMRSIFGIDPPEAGGIEIEGEAAIVRDVGDAIALGMAMAPEDRKLEGLILQMRVDENIALAALRDLTRWGFVRRAALRRVAADQSERLKIKARDLNRPVAVLSGGNQQKVVLAKWLALRPKILILDEPTRGIDVHAKTEIYRIMSELAAEGVGIIMVSSEMEEVLGISDRIVVMHEGAIAGTLERKQFSEQAVMSLATGAAAPAAPSV